MNVEFINNQLERKVSINIIISVLQEKTCCYLTKAYHCLIQVDTLCFL